jgi:hypothetical protein
MLGTADFGQDVPILSKPIKTYVRAAFSDKFGHTNCVILLDSCKLPDLHFPLLRAVYRIFVAKLRNIAKR